MFFSKGGSNASKYGQKIEMESKKGLKFDFGGVKD